MGRPKKGEAGYRKPVKKTGMKEIVMQNKDLAQAESLSISSESDQDDEAISTSQDVFSSLPATQHLLQADTQLLQHQHHQQQSFSLGSILHECMTVRDWNLKVEMPDLENNVACPDSGVMSAPCLSGSSLVDTCRQISPHLPPPSPILMTDTMSGQLQQQLHHLEQHHQQNVKVLDHLHEDSQTQDQGVKYKDISSTVVRMIDGFPINRGLHTSMVIKVENVPSVHGEYGYKYGEDVVVGEDALQGQILDKDDVHSYQMQDLDPNSMFSISKLQTVTAPSKVTTSHSHAGLSSRAAVTNMSSQEVLAHHHHHHHHHHQRAMIKDVNLQPPNLVQNGPRNEHSNSSHKSAQDVNHSQEMAIHVPTSCRGHHVIADSSITNTAHNQQTALAYSRVHNNFRLSPNACSYLYNGSNHHHQFVTASRRLSADNHPQFVSESFSHSKAVGDRNGHRLAALSFHYRSTGGSASASSGAFMNSPTNSHLKLSGDITPVLQEQKDVIQSGRLVKLSPVVVDDRVNVRLHRGQGIHANNNRSSAQRRETHQPIADVRTHSTDSFFMKNEQPIVDDLIHCNSSIPPDRSRSHQPRSYPAGSPNNYTSIELARGQHFTQSSISSDSNSSDMRQFKTEFRTINNNNNNINNNNFNQVNSYTNHNFNEPYISSSPEIVEDNFNSALIRDSALLHDINRIFLAIDNSCETYGCLSSSGCLSPGIAFGDSLDDRITVPGLYADEFSPEISHRYWHGYRLSQRLVLMTPDRLNIINDVLNAFEDLQRTYVTNEPEYVNKVSLDQLEHWHHIQRRIARHVVAGQRFCRNIPGYFKLDIHDRISLGKHVGFGLMVLIACTEFYDPEFKRFKQIWNWTIPMQNPLFSYKLHLLSLGDRIHEISLDRTEAAMMCAVSMTSIDCPNLLKPDVVCVVRDSLLDALKAHIFAKSESILRLKTLLSIMPQVRLMTVWYNNLMKKMSLPSEGTNGKVSMSKVLDVDDTENNPKIS